MASGFASDIGYIPGGYPTSYGYTNCSPAPPVQKSTPAQITPAQQAEAKPYDPLTVGGTSELSFGGSTYGGPIPLVFGADKIQGNVIWSSTIRTDSVVINDTLTFYRSLDFCLALAEGPINEVLRIWLGDRLIYDVTMDVDGSNIPVASNGYVNSQTIDVTDPDSPLNGLEAIAERTSISIFKGGEDQIPYGIMAASEGFINTPAYRGTAYIMFENFIVSSSTVPVIQVEIAANSSTTLPRTTTTSGGTVLTTGDDRFLAVDVFGRNIYYNGSGAASARGSLSVDSGTLDFQTEFEIQLATWTPRGVTWNEGATLLTPNGYIITHANVGNPGHVAIHSVFTGATVGYIGSNGGFDINENGWPGVIDDGCTWRMPDEFGIPSDFWAYTGHWSNDIGIASVSDDGFPRMGPFAATMPKRINFITHVEFTEPMYQRHQLFADGAEARGHFLFYASSGTTEVDSITIGRIKLSHNNLGTWDTLVPLDMGSIPTEELSGANREHTVFDIMVDHGDKTLLIMIRAAPFDWMVKYNPRTNQIVWKTQIEAYSSGNYGMAERARLTGKRYAYITPDDAVHSIDLASGAVETVVNDIVPDQGLGTNSGGGHQFYDDIEDSIVYFGPTDADLNKVWVGRNGQVSSSLQTVVKTLLDRVGVNRADINIAAFSNLTIRGYTAGSVSSISSSFSELRKAFTYEVIESNGKFQYVSRGGASADTIENEYLADSDGTGAFLHVSHESDIASLRKINLSYRDFNREYSTNVQSVFHPKTTSLGFDSDAAIDVTVPIVLNSTESKYIADKLLYAKRVGEEIFTFTAPFRYAALDPGDVVTVEVNADGTDTVLLRLINVRVGADYRIAFEAVLEDIDIYNDDPALTGSTGRFNDKVFLPPGPFLRPVILQISATHPDDYTELEPHLAPVYYTFLNVNGDTTSPASYPVTLSNFADPPVAAPSPFAYPTWGQLLETPPYYSATSTPQADGVFTVKIGNESATHPLASVSALSDLYDDTDGAKNLAILGGEMFQFATATDLGDNVWELSGLVRGRYGSENRANSHLIGETFVLLRDNAGAYDNFSIGKKDFYIANNSGAQSFQISIDTGNPGQLDAVLPVILWPVVPYNVGALAVTYSAGDYTVTWENRSRFDNDLNDDEAESETIVQDQMVEQYYCIVADTDRINTDNTTTFLRKTLVGDTRTFTYTAAEQTEDGFDSATDTLYVWAYQIGDETGESARDPISINIGPQ